MRKFYFSVVVASLFMISINAQAANCQGGGCGALKCSINTSTAGNVSITDAGAGGSASASLSCETYIGSGKSCCCWQTVDYGAWWNPFDTTVNVYAKTLDNADLCQN